MPLHSERYMAYCDDVGKDIIATFIPDPMKSSYNDLHGSALAIYYYWTDDSGAVYDITLNEAFLLDMTKPRESRIRLPKP